MINLSSKKDSVEDCVWYSVEDFVWSSVRDDVRHYVMSGVWGKVLDSVDYSVWLCVNECMDSKLYD